MFYIRPFTGPGMVSDKREVSDFLNELIAAGIADIVLSPGSRNAPFSVSLYQNPDFTVIPVADERTAGFIALGRAQQLRKPVVLICTSGTAVLNYGPALAEAYYQRIPLIAVSADRPAEWIDHGEGQSIRQTGVFQNFVRAFADIKAAASDAQRAENRECISRTIAAAIGPIAGPVHLNFPFEEPLYGLTEWEGGAVGSAQSAALPVNHLSECASDIRSAQKILVLAGQLFPTPGLSEALHAWTGARGIAVMTESHSNLASPDFITTIDRLITGWSAEDKKRFAPDVLITFGQNIISRRVKSWLRQSGCVHWRIDEGGYAEDTYRKLKGVIACTPDKWLQAMADVDIISTYASDLRAANTLVREKAEEVVEQLPYSDLTVTRSILRTIPAGWDVQMGNSSVVRYIQLFDTNPALRYFGNRGVSGIDGVTSTAVGAASVTDKPTVLITGDIAFLYDSNAFWTPLRPHNLRIIVVNNSGGGIFRIIEGPSSTPALDDYFETTHSRSAEGIARMYALPFQKVNAASELSSALEWLFGHKGCAILEIRTPRTENDKVLNTYFHAIKSIQS